MKGRKGGFGKGDIKGGGDSNPPVKTINATGSKVFKEAMERKRGGKVHGDMMKKRLDRPGRKRGGRVGADSAPLSSAANMTRSSGDRAEDG